MAIGIVDSGIGGYSIAREIHECSMVDIVFLADQKHIPYGERRKEDLLLIMKENLKWFQSMNISEVLIACNTASTLISELSMSFPDMKLYGVIDITSKQFEKISVDKLLVLATSMTVDSGCYQQLLSCYMPKTKLFFEKCPGLVELIEANSDTNTIKAYFDEHFNGYKESGIAVLFACTHFPLLHQQFHDYLKGASFDSFECSKELFSSYKGNQEFLVYTSGNPEYLTQQIKSLFNDEIVGIQK